MQKIVFIQTGGTIDKDYPKQLKSYAFEIAEPAVARMMKKVRPGFRYQIIPLLKKDSLDMTDDDRALIYQTCLTAQAKRIIITHGTDTMIETARVLSSIQDKTIILTGALLPERFVDSDALFNVGVAIGAVQLVQDGVYIAMSGQIYPWNKCIKSPKTARFISL